MIYHDYLFQSIQTVMKANDAYYMIQRPLWRAKAANNYRDDKIATAKYLAMLREKASNNRRQIAIMRHASRRLGVHLNLKDIP